MAEGDAGRRWAVARSSWAGIAVAEEAYAAWLARRPDAPEVNDADQYLACACSLRAPGSLEAFDRAHLSKVGAMLARHHLAPGVLEDLAQGLRERLFVQGHIADYSGRGSLSSWLRVIAVRAAVDLTRKKSEALLPETSGSGPLAGVRAPGELELDYLKDAYRSAVGDALKASLRSLPSEQRNLLRLHFAEGLTLEELAGLFHVHRATVARRLAAARDAVLDDARRRFSAEMKVAPEEVDSLFLLVRSQVDVTLSSALAAGSEG